MLFVYLLYVESSLSLSVFLNPKITPNAQIKSRLKMVFFFFQFLNQNYIASAKLLLLPFSSPSLSSVSPPRRTTRLSLCVCLYMYRLFSGGKERG